MGYSTKYYIGGGGGGTGTSAVAIFKKVSDHTTDITAADKTLLETAAGNDQLQLVLNLTDGHFYAWEEVGGTFQWIQSDTVVEGPKGLDGDAGEMSADNLVYVSASANPAIALADQDGSRMNPFATIQYAIDWVDAHADYVGVEVVDASVYNEDLSITEDTFLYAPSATIIGDATIATGKKLSMYAGKYIGELDDTKTIGSYRDINGVMMIAENVKIADKIYMGKLLDPNSWQINEEAGIIEFHRYEHGAYTLKHTIGSSIKTDVIYLDKHYSSINIRDTDPVTGKIIDYNLIKRGLNNNHIGVGDMRINKTEIGAMNAVSMVRPLIADTDNPDLSLLTRIIQGDSTETQNVKEFTYSLVANPAPYGTDSYFIKSLELANTVHDTFSVTITNGSGDEVYKTVSDFDLEYGRGAVTEGTGVHAENQYKVLILTPGDAYTIKIQFQNTIPVLGATNSGTGIFEPYFAINYWNLTDTDLRLKQKIRVLSSDLNINVNNRRIYGDNLLINESTVDDVNVTLDSDVASVDDEISFRHVGSPTGSITVIQTGGTIEGESKYEVENGNTITLKLTSANTWIIVSGAGAGDTEDPNNVDIFTDDDYIYTVVGVDRKWYAERMMVISPYTVSKTDVDDTNNKAGTLVMVQSLTYN